MSRDSRLPDELPDELPAIHANPLLQVVSARRWRQQLRPILRPNCSSMYASYPSPQNVSVRFISPRCCSQLSNRARCGRLIPVSPAPTEARGSSEV